MALVAAGNNSALATAYSSQRHVDRCSNGVLWSLYWDGFPGTGTTIHLRYSLDNGSTWSDGGGFGFGGFSSSWAAAFSASLFIDADDYAHVVYKDADAGYLLYRRGTPNAGRTAWAWSGSFALSDSGNRWGNPDIVAHRSGTGWKAHVVATLDVANATYYTRVDITSAGALSLDTGLIGSTQISGTYGGAATWPSIDFNHTGDGKTVASSSPHLYVSWSADVAGAGKGIRFKKAAYSGGSWTWGTEREIDSASFAAGGAISSVFDGSRVLIAYANSASTGAIKVRERDAGDVTTTVRTPPALSDGAVKGVSVSYNPAGGILLAAFGATSRDPKWTAYDRSAGTWSAWATVAAGTAADFSLTLQRGVSGGKTAVLWTDGAASPYSVMAGSIASNATPNAPTVTVSSVIDRAGTNRVSVPFNDPDPGDSQSRLDIQWWDLDGTGARVGAAHTYSQVNPVQYWDAPPATFTAGAKEIQGKSYDAQGAASPWSASAFFTAADAPSAPTITAPANGATVGVSAAVTWSTPSQDAYQVQVLDGGAVVSDTGEVTDAATRSLALSFPTNNTTRTVKVRRKYGGLWSPWASVTVTVSWTPPAAPTGVKTSVPSAGAIDLAITNPTPGAGEPSVAYNNIYFAEPGEAEERKATLVPPNSTWRHWLPASDAAYTYRIVAVAANGATSETVVS